MKYAQIGTDTQRGQEQAQCVDTGNKVYEVNRCDAVRLWQIIGCDPDRGGPPKGEIMFIPLKKKKYFCCCGLILGLD